MNRLRNPFHQYRRFRMADYILVDQTAGNNRNQDLVPGSTTLQTTCQIHGTPNGGVKQISLTFLTITNYFSHYNGYLYLDISMG